MLDQRDIKEVSWSRVRRDPKEAFNEKTNTHVNIEIINRDVKP